MNILEICLGEGLGGLELYFRKCCTRLSKSNKVVTVTRKETRLAQISKDEDDSHYQMETQAKIFSIKAIKELIRIVKKENIDLIHVHHKNDLPLVAWVKFFSNHKFKVVHTRQMQLPGSKKDPYHRFIYGSLDLFLAISEGLKIDAQNKLHISKNKIKRLYYGVEKADPNMVDRGFIKDSNQFKIGIFSRIEHQKGQHTVIEAGLEILKINEDVDFYFVGDVMDDDYKEEIVRKINREQLNRFHFKGFHPKPLTIMPLFDIIILPSKNETFGLVVVEAMRAGVAVIGTNAGGVPEIIDDNLTGLLFEWDNSSQLARKITALIENKELRMKLALEGEKKADLVFNIDDHFNTLDAIFEDLVKPSEQQA